MEKYPESFLKELSIDDAINEIGSGKFHYKMLLLIFFVSYQQISQIVLPGVVLKSIQVEFNATRSEVSFYGTMEYLGYLISSITLGTVSDKLGRRKSILIYQIIWICCIFLSVLSTNIYFYSIVRCMQSMSFLSCALCGFSLIGEIWPQKTRGLVLNFFGIIVSCSYAITSLIAFLFIKDFENADWRSLFLIYASLLVVSIILNYKFLVESPRYDLFFGQRKRAFETLESMALINLNRNDYLTETKKEQIEMWVENFIQHLNDLLGDNKGKGFFSDYKKLFQGNYKRITLIMFFIWIILSSNCFATEFVLPIIFSKISDINPLLIMTIINAITIPSLVPFILLAERPKFGRKNTLRLIYFIMGFGAFCFYLNLFPRFFWLFLFKTSYHAGYMTIYLFTSELYPTKLRVNAIGQCSAISRVGVVVVVWITVFLLDINPQLPFLIFGILGFAAFFMLGFLPYDTLNESMERLLFTKDKS